MTVDSEKAYPTVTAVIRERAPEPPPSEQFPWLTIEQVQILIGPRKYSNVYCARCGKGRPDVDPVYSVCYGTLHANAYPLLCGACYHLWLMHAAMFFPDPRNFPR